ncbi:Hypothetical protein CINCED_3A003396 [Cinara cedri]|nr:Hypothetical protein CINCED_3A003396 [Cinara cedri]
MSGTVFDGDEVKKVADQLAQSGLSVANHLNQWLGIPISAADNQKSYEKVKSLLNKSQTELESDLDKLKELLTKNVDVKLKDKIDELEKEIKKQTNEAKALFDDKIAKPINDKYKDDIKKITDSVVKATKEVETTVTKAIDNAKKQ